MAQSTSLMSVVYCYEQKMISLSLVIFGDLLGIWIVNGTDVIFRVAELETVTFSDTLNSYEIDKLGQAMSALYITPDSLLSHEVLHKWELDQKMYINTKYDVTDLCDSL